MVIMVHNLLYLSKLEPFSESQEATIGGDYVEAGCFYSEKPTPLATWSQLACAFAVSIPHPNKTLKASQGVAPSTHRVHGILSRRILEAQEQNSLVGPRYRNSRDLAY